MDRVDQVRVRLFSRAVNAKGENAEIVIDNVVAMNLHEKDQIFLELEDGTCALVSFMSFEKKKGE